MVILELFCRTGTGNFGLGILVSHKRKSRCTYCRTCIKIVVTIELNACEYSCLEARLICVATVLVLYTV